MSKQDNPLKKAAVFTGVGIQMGIIILLGAYAGVKLDENYPNKNNMFTIVCSLCAVVASIIYVIRRVIKISKEN